MTYRRFLEILLWLVKGTTIGLALFVFIWLFNKYFVPFGKLEFSYDFSEDSPFISHLEPWQRLMPVEEVNGDFFQAMKDDLVYFDVKIPRWFEKVSTEITFQSPEHPILELGARLDEQGRYLDKTLQNKLIDELDWSQIKEGDTIFFQREKRFDNLTTFLSAIPRDKKTGFYFYKLTDKKLIQNYQKSNQKTSIDQTLRGSHTIFTYLKDEDLNFEFSKVDLNWYPGPDELSISVFKENTGEKVYNNVIPDDGIQTITSTFLPEQILNINIPNLEEGSYRIELTGSDDVLITKIVTSQKLVVFSRKLFLADNEEYFKDLVPGSKPSTIFTDATNLKFKTSHPAGFQKISAESNSLDIPEINKSFSLMNLSGISQVTIPKNDVLIESEGFYSFSESQLFNPYPEHITALRYNTDIDSLDYIVAQYSSPIVKNEWYSKSQSFSLNQLYRDSQNQIRFRLSAPGLTQEGRIIKISKIKISFEKPKVTWQNFFPKLENYILRKIKNI